MSKDTKRENSIFMSKDFYIGLNSSFYLVERNIKEKKSSLTLFLLLLLLQISLSTKRKIMTIIVIKYL